MEILGRSIPSQAAPGSDAIPEMMPLIMSAREVLDYGNQRTNIRR